MRPFGFRWRHSRRIYVHSFSFIKKENVIHFGRIHCGGYHKAIFFVCPFVFRTYWRHMLLMDTNNNLN